MLIKNPAKGLVAHGVNHCHGCGLELAGRVILDVLGPKTVLVIPPGCAALFSGFGNETTVRVPGFQGNLENTAAYAAGIKAGLEITGREDVQVLGLAGDGATVDIGLQSLSGALERGDKILYCCYDNEAYMNTGIQCSSSTPKGAWTTTTPGGKTVGRKNLIQIVMAHGIPYAATASVAYVDDLRTKVEKAKAVLHRGPAFLHIHAPCPTGWGFEASKCVEVAKLAVQCRSWALLEVLDGTKVNITQTPKKPIPVEDYLKAQKRFKSLTAEAIAMIQQTTDLDFERWQKIAAM